MFGRAGRRAGLLVLLALVGTLLRSRTRDASRNAPAYLPDRSLSNWRLRIALVALVLATLWYVPWLLGHLNPAAPVLGLMFAFANLLMAEVGLIAVWIFWHRRCPAPRVVPVGMEPCVAVIVPTCGEPPEMVGATLESILGGDWPHARLRVVVSDDAHAAAVAEVVAASARRSPAATVLYHEPPPRGAPARRGDAKAGNLNSALELVRARFPEVGFVETRDADDLSTPGFLRACVAQLQDDPRAAYVQTIKQARVSVGDPFNNTEALFYHGVMPAKHASNAVFPCGSGLVWRETALRDIGDFPSWNLVEDLQSGVEALRRGWRGLFLPIVGAIAQHAPEDIPNFYKQRGTWALDTVRLLVWGNTSGLTLRQHLHFAMLGLFYVLSFPILLFAVIPPLALVLGLYPVASSSIAYLVHFAPYALAVEAFLAALNHPLPYGGLWRMRWLWLGLTPVYLRACWSAVAGGPSRKPSYRVTRKQHQHGWYWRETFAQTVLAVVIAGAVIARVLRGTDDLASDLGVLVWSLFFFVLLYRFVRLGWFGRDWRASAVSTYRSVRSAAGHARLRTDPVGGPKRSVAT